MCVSLFCNGVYSSLNVWDAILRSSDISVNLVLVLNVVYCSLTYLPMLILSGVFFFFLFSKSAGSCKKQ